jgi:hypothetical protein
MSKSCLKLSKNCQKSCQQKLSKSCPKVVKNCQKSCQQKLSKSCQIYQKVGCKKTKILKRVGEEGEEGEEDL